MATSFPPFTERLSNVQALRRLAQARIQERCDFCSVPLSTAHRHLLEMATRQIVCACDPCALRFQQVVAGRFKLIPREAKGALNVRMTDAQWESLSLPINLAFFFQNSTTGKMTAMYPSPAGAMESLLTIEHWNDLLRDNPGLAEMEPDVEALLVNRLGTAREYFVAPIDVCYELVGLIRTHWRGLSGGDAVWQAIAETLTRLRGGPPQPDRIREVPHA
jgi:uncharacterized protein DUF5947